MKFTQLKTLLLIVLATSLGLFSASCSKKQKSDSGAESFVNEADIQSDFADSDSGKAGGLQTVQFAYDSATLDEGAKQTLKTNAKLLKEKTNLKVQIEGHCDERGGIQYNIALGERRAKAAKSFIVAAGVPSARITTISYGKEKPIDLGHDESALAKNRRANFRITEK